MTKMTKLEIRQIGMNWNKCQQHNKQYGRNLNGLDIQKIFEIRMEGKEDKENQGNNTYIYL